MWLAAGGITENDRHEQVANSGVSTVPPAYPDISAPAARKLGDATVEALVPVVLRERDGEGARKVGDRIDDVDPVGAGGAHQLAGPFVGAAVGAGVVGTTSAA